MNLSELLDIPAALFPEREILRFEGRSTSYAELLERSQRMAGALRGLGIETGDRIAVLDTNSPTLVQLLYGAASLGAVAVPLNFRAAARELASMLQAASPRLLLVSERYRDMGLESVFSPPIPLLEIESLDRLVQDAEQVGLVAEDEQGPAMLLFTSGTTAAAKAVRLGHRQLIDFVLNTTEPPDGLERGSVLVAAPLHHIAGLSAVLSATFTGRRIVLMRQFEAGEWLRLVADENVTHAFLVPTMIRQVLDHPDFPHANLSSLELLSYGAAPMPLALIRRSLESFPSRVRFINAFGQTETTSTVTMLGPEDHRLEGTPEEVEKKLHRLTSIGRPLSDVELRIVDDAGQLLPPGEVGEIVVRTERMMQGYYGEEDQSDPKLDGGWLHTRDLAWTDEDGYVYLSGRQSEMIIRGGENIAPEEVEAVLESHPDVEEAAVIGVPDEEWGERVGAVIVARADTRLSGETLIAFCRERLASFKKPDVVWITDEALPRNALGKLVRRELRARYS